MIFTLDAFPSFQRKKAEGLERAKSMIERMFQEIEVGKVYTGKIVSITAFGAFTEALIGKDGLIDVLAESNKELPKSIDSFNLG